MAGAFGLGAGYLRRDAFLAVPVAISAAIVVAHSLSMLEFYYYAVKIPFLVAFAFYGVDLLPRAPRLAMLLSLCGITLTLSGFLGFVPWR